MSTDNPPKRSVARSTWIVSAGTAFSRVSGLLREQVMAYYFGAGMATDAFVLAFRIPNLLRDLFAEGALSSSFVPVFKERLVQQTQEEAFKLANIVITAMTLVLGIVTILGIAATPTIIYLTAHGFTEEADKFALTVNLTRMMWFFLPLVSISALIMGMLNSFDHFGLPAMSPSMFNLGSVLTVVCFYHYFDMPVYTLGIGVIVGGIGQIAIQMPSLWKIGYRFRFRLSLFDEGLKKMMRLFTPMMIGLSAGRINILVNTLLVSFLAEGSISYLNYSFRLMHFPLGVFAVALGTVALPRAAEIASRGDMDQLSRVFHEALNLNFLLIVPSAFALALLGKEIVELTYHYGAFSELHTTNTALALLHYSYGLIGFAAVRVIVPVFYGLGDSRVPMRTSVISVVVNLVLYYPLMKLMNFAGLAAATSVAGLVNAGLLIYYLPSKGVPVRYDKIALNFVRIMAASALAMLIGKFLPLDMFIGTDSLAGRLVHSIVPLSVAAVVYVVLCSIMGVRELTVLREKLFRRRRRT